MLEAMRQNSRSAIIYILFAVLIAAFVITFAPGGLGGGAAERGGHYAAKVAGDEVAEHEFNLASLVLEYDFRRYYQMMGMNNPPAQMLRQRMKEWIMDRLIDREIFADEAERMGLAVSEKEAAELVTEGRMIIAGIQLSMADPGRTENYAMKGGKFDYERFRQVAENHYRMTIKRLMEIQQRELLAFKLRQIMTTSVKASPDEVRARFEVESRQANLDFVRFPTSRYEDELSLSDTDVENWARAHEDAIKKAYDERKFMYEKQERAAHLRRILIALPKDPEPAKTDAKDSKDAKDPKAEAPKPEAAKAEAPKPDPKAEALLKGAQARLDAAKKTLQSGTKFADVARTASEDASAKKGGDMGWKKKGFTGLGDEAEKQIFAAKEGDVLGPLRTAEGLELIKVEGFREGDISLGQARGELAEQLAREDKLKEKARAAAKEAADKVKAGGKLAELYPKSDSDADEAKPKAGKGAKVSVEETGLFAQRGDAIQSIGSSQDLVKQVFGKMKVGDTVGPVEVGGAFVVATLKERKELEPAEWDKRKTDLTENYLKSKAGRIAETWARARCSDLKTKDKIHVNADLMAFESGNGAKDPMALLQPKYEPCAAQRGLF